MDLSFLNHKIAVSLHLGNEALHGAEIAAAGIGNIRLVVEPMVAQSLEMIVPILHPHPQDFILGVEREAFAGGSADDVLGLQKGMWGFAECIGHSGGAPHGQFEC